jgi:membrane protease subunit HflK
MTDHAHSHDAPHHHGHDRGHEHGHGHGHEHPHGPRRIWPWLAGLALAALAVWAATGVYSVRHNERAVVQRFGRALDELRGPGLHVGLPVGLDRVTRLRMFEVKRVAVGMTIGQRALGRTIEPQQAETLTGDWNLVTVAAVVHYEIRRPRVEAGEDKDTAAHATAYLFRAADVAALIRDAAGAALTSAISQMVVDDVLTTGREAIRAQVRARTQAALDRYGVAVDVTDVLIENLAPPAEVADAFRDVTRARADKGRAVNDAEGYAAETVQQARGEAQRLRTEAEGYAAEVVAKARGDADRFARIAAEAAHSRELTTRRLLLETAEAVLPRLRKVILDDKARRGLDLGIIETEE